MSDHPLRPVERRMKRHALSWSRGKAEDLVRFVSQLRQSDFAGKVGETLAGKVFMMAIGMVTTVLVSRILGPGGRGLYATAMTITAIGVQFGNFGLPSSNVYYVARDPRVLGTVLGNSLVVGFIGMGVLTALLGGVFLLRPDWALISGLLLVLALGGIPLGVTVQLCQNLLLAVGKVRPYYMVDVVGKVVSVGVILYLIFMGFINPESLYAVSLVILVGSILWITLALRRQIEGGIRFSFGTLRNHLGYGFRAYLANFFSYLVLSSDQLIVQRLLGSDATGYYSVAAALANYMFLIPSTIGTLLFPKVSAAREAGAQWRMTHRAVWAAVWLMGVLAVIAYFLADPLIPLVFGKAFLPSVAAFRWLLPGIFFLSLQVILVQFLSGRGMPIWIVWVWLVAFLVNLVLNILWIPRFGFLGASYSSSLVYFLVFVAMGWYIRRILPKAKGEAK